MNRLSLRAMPSAQVVVILAAEAYCSNDCLNGSG